MSRSYNKCISLLAVVVMLAGGCAKQEVVKKDEVIPAAVASKRAEPADKVVNEKEAALKEQPVKETPVKGEGIEGAMKAAKADAQTEAAIQTIFFDLDSYMLSPAAREALAANAKKFAAIGGAKIRIEGNCDERGSDEYNLALGEKRARSAMKYLVTMGIPAERLSTISYGKEKPAAAGHDETAWAKNRRDDFVLLK